MKIKDIDAYEVLDSRGNPTVRVELTTENGIKVGSQVPSGASTGEHEALELRDGDKARYGGKGVLKAVENVREIIKPALVGMAADQQREIDQKMLEMDGTENKSKLGANAILGVSMAATRAAALGKKIPLYEHIRELAGEDKEEQHFPDPLCNVINGGAHADSGMDFQEYMLVPVGIKTFSEKMRALSEIYQALKQQLKGKGKVTAVGDEGGFAPKLATNEEPLGCLMKAIEAAGYRPGDEIKLAMDVAASEFYDKDKGKYVSKLENKELSSVELADYYEKLAKKYPLLLIEDGMAENDWEGWQGLMEKLGETLGIMGDDFTVTNPKRLAQAIEKKALNSILIKLNQIGSVSETLDCVKLAHENGIKAAVSHRSGETADNFIADFAVGVKAAWIKTGSVARSERVAKYNRLLGIEREWNQR